MFAMRNGVIADSLRKAGSPFPIIFGMNLPQIKEMVEKFGKDSNTAWLLWNDRRTRESMLAATMMFRADELNEDEISRLISDVNCAEVADVLCLKLLRNKKDAVSLAQQILESGNDAEMELYLGIRLLWNLVSSDPETVGLIAQKEVLRDRPVTKALAEALIEEAKFLTSED